MAQVIRFPQERCSHYAHKGPAVILILPERRRDPVIVAFDAMIASIRALDEVVFGPRREG